MDPLSQITFFPMEKQNATQHDIKLSKLLSYVLRHGAKKMNINMDSSGCVLISELLLLPKFKTYTLKDIERVVKQNDKQRFAIVDHSKIRANQGHSLTCLNPEEMLEKNFITEYFNAFNCR